MRVLANDWAYLDPGICGIVTWGGCVIARSGLRVRYSVMMFKEIYCAETGCPETDFVRRVFWQCLHPHARWVAPLIDATSPHFFAADRELIELVGRLRSTDQLQSEIRDFVTDDRNRHWWRRRAQLRVSTQRLRRLVRKNLARGETAASLRPAA